MLCIDMLSVLFSFLSFFVIQVWGFGARVGNGPVRHCFPLNLNEADPNVTGVQGILDTYARGVQVEDRLPFVHLFVLLASL